MKRLLIYCFALIICVSCSKDEVSPQMDWDIFYPLSIGTTRVYECTNITIDVPVGTNDTSIFYIREEVAECIGDTNACKVYAEHCWKSDSPNGPWEPYVSLSIQKFGHAIVRVENNEPFQILRFPATKNYTWNINQYNTRDEQQVFYSDIFVSDTISNIVYDSVLVVSQQDFKSLYTYQFSEERYAKNVGLIYRKNIDVESQPNHAKIDLTKPIEERITKGTMTTFKLITIK